MNVLGRGEEYILGQVVLNAGKLIRPGEVAVLASVGSWWTHVFRQPEVAVMATGDELILAEEALRPGKIRDTNSPTLEALLTAVGAERFLIDKSDEEQITPDDPERIRSHTRRGLESDVLLLTGGVSMGTADFVPRVLAELGVKQVFHKVALKPGMPVWFGTHDKGLVFGLPGNPVSVLCCFELFVTTALRARQGWADPYPRFFNAKLAGDFTYPTKRETYHPAKLTFTDDGPVVSPVPWFGSADVLGASRADALAVLPVGPGNHKTGDRLRVLPLSKPGWIWTCSGVGGAS
jgi:molybdopterin molybdotransferase